MSKVSKSTSTSKNTRKRKPAGLPALEFSRRAKVSRSDVSITRLATTRSYPSRDGLYEVCEVIWSVGYGRYWLAIGRPGSPRPFISKHRTRQAAERRCRDVAKGV